METMLVCPKPKTQCKKQINKFSMIDLTPLRKGFRNWLINNNKEKLIFNVGSGLAFQQGFLCSGGSIAACLQKSDGTLINYGDTFDRIEVKSNSVSIFIRNGEQCGSERYSLNITLIEDLNKSNPIIIKNNNCSKDIEWRTPYATAVEYFQGKNCNIKTNIEYAKDLNFTNLFIQDYRLQTEDGTSFRINLCSRLKEKCGQFTDARICWTDEFNKQHAIGLYDEELVLKKRSSEFYIRGESCSKDYPYSEVYFTMACSFYEQELILMAKDGCQFYFYWKTREACIFKDEKPGKCTVEDPNTNNVYNLSALSLTSDNYKIILNITHTLILNICRSLVPQYNNQCNMNSGACLMITSAQSPHSISYQSIAMSDVLNVSNSHGVRLTYLKTMLSDCQLTIDFVCNHIESVKVVNINDKCSYHLIWHTEHACPRKKRANNTINCFATDFHTNQQYDLTSLSTKMYEINGYYVSICQPLFNNSCDKNSSVCTKNSVSYGSFSTKIKVLDNSLMLVYNSTSCKSTVIYFVCGMLEDAPKTLNKVNDCLLVIYWPTPLACLRNAICDNDKDKKFQLPNFYNITVPEGFVYLKICSQLDPHPKIICPGGSAACLVTDSGDQKSLGYPLEKPTRRKDSLVLHYPNGDLCDEKKRLHFSTNITLVCNQDKKEDGVHFKELYNCQYKFEWQTTLACETEHKQTLHECLLPSGKQRDMLNHFFTNGIHNIYIDDLYISLCDTKSLCSADVCIKKADQFIWKPFGNLFFNTVLSDNHDTSILYKPFKSDLQCFGKVTLSCDTSIGKGPKIISMVPDCSFEVLWNTPLACDVTEISDSVNNDNFTMSDSKGWWVAGIALSTTIFVSYTALILCRRIKRTQRETNIESLPMLPVP
ncbi:cation-independent mannose-6-phosphate receptor isoform X1 [Cimex lectularius]|uniref:MRH domain-containing protein n=1 Tax=Cimex lectularius TaxID=79782 RepID=A0A8I6SL17_CIMLE|nr:cation-independent mannose-6-phosphate receptor isoform X1 [Cimex lectularius]